MILRDVMVPGKELRCDQCGFEWVSISQNKLPDFCPNRQCRSREWNGKKKRRKPSQERIAFPKPPRIRGTEEEF